MIAKKIVMVEPVRFGFNEEAAKTNAFQRRIPQFDDRQIQEIARVEFNNMVLMLQAHGIQVEVFTDLAEPVTPDAIFPNNWFSTSPYDRTLLTYPMATSVRSLERRPDVLQDLSTRFGYEVDRSLTVHESSDQFLEGTGSLVLDHINKLAFAAISPRTHLPLLQKWCEMTGYTAVPFEALGPAGEQIYHTNVMMCVADEYVVICMDSIADSDEKAHVIKTIENCNKKIIDISEVQMNAFAGNMIQLQNEANDKFLVMSSSARISLNAQQVSVIEKEFNNTIIAPSINVIETVGGGSARCMIAELF